MVTRSSNEISHNDPNLRHLIGIFLAFASLILGAMGWIYYAPVRHASIAIVPLSLLFVGIMFGFGSLILLHLATDDSFKTKIFYFFCVALLFPGVAAFFNGAMDQSTPQQYTVQVKSSSWSHGKNSTGAIVVRNWRDVTQEINVGVDTFFAQGVHSGDWVAIQTKDGVFGLEWIEKVEYASSPFQVNHR